MDLQTNVLWIGEQKASSLPSYSALPRAFFSVMPCRLRTALKLIEERFRYNVIVIEAATGEMSDSGALKAVLSADSQARIVVLEEDGSAESAEAWLRQGAVCHVTQRSHLRKAIETAVQGLERETDSSRKALIGDSEPMQRIRDMVSMIGPRRSNVLIVGETGTGKEVVARALHNAGPRSQMPMICVNCAAIPETLIESELFGHVKGAFTGAVNARPGKFEEANGGTIFLDEIGELPLNMQAKLLRVLQEREVQRLGSSETVKLDVRVIAATNADLENAVKEGRFREDLFYRISVVPVELPPLRERMSDLPGLVEHFMRKICKQEDLPHKTFPAETINRLSAYHWPGNVRQLEHAVELAIVMSGSRSVLLPSDFSLPGRKLEQVSNTRDLTISVPEHGFDYETTISGIERWIIQQALTRAAGNKAKAASMLGLKRTTLSAKTRALALDTNTEVRMLQAC